MQKQKCARDARYAEYAKYAIFANQTYQTKRVTILTDPSHNFELKMFNEYSMSWVHCAFGNFLCTVKSGQNKRNEDLNFFHEEKPFLEE